MLRDRCRPAHTHSTNRNKKGTWGVMEEGAGGENPLSPATAADMSVNK